METNNNRRILIIDDNRAIHEDFVKILAAKAESMALKDLESSIFGGKTAGPVKRTYEIDSAFQGQEGCELVRKQLLAGIHYPVAFVDMRMPPGWDGVQTIETLWEIDPDIQVVICTAYSDYSWEDIIKRLGAVDRMLILKKPFDTAEVCQLACALTEKWHLARHAHLKLGQLQSMVREQTHELQFTMDQLRGEVAERQKKEEALKASEDRYVLALAGANDGLWDWDLVHDKVFYSARWKAMLGYGDSEISNDPNEWFGRVHSRDLDRVKAECAINFKSCAEPFCIEYRMLHRDGGYRWMLCRGLAARDASGTAIRAAGSLSDVTDRKMAEEQLRHDALHDTLTGLANRTLLTDRIEHCMRRAKRTPGFQFAVLFMDLDRFKIINDSLGHNAGDELLVAVARRLTTTVRELDIVTRAESDELARLGGDEFVLLLDGISAPADTLRVAERLQQVLAAPFLIDGQSVVIAASIGIAIGEHHYEQPQDILRDADAALYRAKESGRARCQLFSPEMHATAMTRWWMETELRAAINEGLLTLTYQPIVSLETGELVEVEALARWTHPVHGVVPPCDFIPIAEESGLIVPLGAWVLNEACTQLREWVSKNPKAAKLSVGVNVSGRQIARTDFADIVQSTLAHTGILPQQLRLEMTESSIIDSGASTMDALNRLRESGVELHLDDFGTGYSSLSCLHRLPISTMKIDHSFVAKMDSDKTSASIVQAIIALGRALHLTVIAEGIETESQRVKLRDMGCTQGQGYLFGRPMDAAQIAELLKATPQRAAA